MTTTRSLLGAGLLIIAAVSASSGCAPWATYPSVETTGRFTKGTFEPFPDLMAAAIRHAHDKSAVEGQPIYINLPEGSTHELYEEVIEDLGEGQPMTDAFQPAYHITEVRTRSPKAQVDIVYPLPNSDRYEIATLFFSFHMLDGWYVKDTRVWRIPTDPLPPHYTPPVDDEPTEALAETDPNWEAPSAD